jgi:hypothetical protein
MHKTKRILKNHPPSGQLKLDQLHSAPQKDPDRITTFRKKQIIITESNVQTKEDELAL